MIDKLIESSIKNAEKYLGLINGQEIIYNALNTVFGNGVKSCGGNKLTNSVLSIELLDEFLNILTNGLYKSNNFQIDDFETIIKIKLNLLIFLLIHKTDDPEQFIAFCDESSIFSNMNLHEFIIGYLYINRTSYHKINDYLINSDMFSDYELSFRDFINRFDYSDTFDLEWAKAISKSNVLDAVLLYDNSLFKESLLNIKNLSELPIEICPHKELYEVRLMYLTNNFINTNIRYTNFLDNRTYLSHYEYFQKIMVLSIHSNLEIDKSHRLLPNVIHDDRYFNTFIDYISELILSHKHKLTTNFTSIESFVEHTITYLKLDDLLYEFNKVDEPSIIRKVLHIKPIDYNEKLSGIKSALHRKLMFRKISNTLLFKNKKENLIKI